MATKYKEKLIKFECSACKRINYFSQKNKKLNKEQQKLTEKVSGLQENLETLKTQTAEILPPKPTLKDMMKNIFKRKEKETL
jgi:ribosomal protein L33